ncbi:hypothetical protein [Treponema pectinovorum]|uniref:hypothetical protein n=1 Tax=Treponema pectinovorum TaxID=164 RepID=UPI0011F2AFB2|nr:hypothetical protein [Treponema pectinovorum]
MKNSFIVCFLLIFSFLLTPVFSASENSTNYDDINFPQWTKDLRRTEIITFGSLPFVTLWTSLGYGLIVQGSFHNPLDKSTSSYTQEQQKQIMMIAVSTSLALGLTDLLINLITRKIAKNKQNQVAKSITVIPLSKLNSQEKTFTPESFKFEESDLSETEDIENPTNSKKEYFIDGMEDAVY